VKTTTNTPRRALKSHFDAVVYFFSLLDSEMISDLLDSDRMYQGFPKHIFVRKLGDLFHDLRKLGDSRLMAMVDDEPLPINGNFGVTFEGNITSLYLEIVFEVDEVGFITDIYEVPESTENKESQFSKRQRVFIDQFSDNDLSFTFGEEDDSSDGWDDDFIL